jgi:hypothetical protein
MEVNNVPIIGAKPQEPPKVQLIVAPHPAGMVMSIIRDGGLDVHHAPLDLQGGINVMMELGKHLEQAQPGTLIPILTQWIGMIEKQQAESRVALEMLNGR